MTDDVILGLDGQPAAEPEQHIETDANGDPIRQGSLMDERQSYERVIEGLKMITDACAHLIHHEPLQADYWRGFMTRFDQARRICVQQAGLGLVMQQKETQDVRGAPMPWRKCRQQFLEGVTQAAGGCRQLATCHRGDLWWSTMAGSLDDLARKLSEARRAAVRKAVRPVPRDLILPSGYSRH